MDVPAIEPAADGRDDLFDMGRDPIESPAARWNPDLLELHVVGAARAGCASGRGGDRSPRSLPGRHGQFLGTLIDLQLLDVDDNSCDWIRRRFVPPSPPDRSPGRRYVRRNSPPRGTALRFEGSIPDQMHEELGSSFWSLPSGDDAARLGVRFLASAFEGRWGGAAHLGDHLIVPAGHPLLDDPSRSRQLTGRTPIDGPGHVPRRAGLTSEGMPRGRNVHRDDSSTGASVKPDRRWTPGDEERWLRDVDAFLESRHAEARDSRSFEPPGYPDDWAMPIPGPGEREVLRMDFVHWLFEVTDGPMARLSAGRGRPPRNSRGVGSAGLRPA